MLKGAAVEKYISDHPEIKEAIKGIEFQHSLPKTMRETHKELYRPLELSDIRFISFEGWQGEKGVFAWYYPCGVPHYAQIGGDVYESSS